MLPAFSDRMRRHCHPAWYWAFVAALPVVYIAGQVIASSRNVAFWDEFASLDFVLRLDAHQNWADVIAGFFATDNEHRTFTTRLFFALNYWLTGEINFHVIGAVGNLSLLALCAALVAATRGTERRVRLAVLLAFGVYQLEPFEAFVWSGASIDHFQVLFLSGAALIALQRGSRQATLAAALLALLATLTLAQGCVTWPVGALILARARRWRALAAWGALCGLTMAVYLYGFQIYPQHRLSSFSPAHLAQLGAYWLTLLGSPPVLGQPALAPYAGAVLLAALGWLLQRRTWAREPVLMPLALFAVGSLVLVAVGRLEVAPAGMINSRYFIIGALAWTAVVAMLVERFTPAAHPYRLLAGALPVLALFNIAADVRFAPLARVMVEARDRAASTFKQFGEDGHGVFRLHPVDGCAAQVLAAARDRGIYRLPRYSEPQEFPLAQPSERIMSSIDKVIANRRAVTVEGWATIPGEASRRGHIYLVLRSAKSFLIYSTLTLERGDVVRAFHQPGWELSGFRAVIGCQRLPKENFDVGVLIDQGDRAEFKIMPDRLLLAAAEPQAVRLAAQN